MELKDTLHLGRTKFAMRAGLAKKEPAMQKDWAAANLYEKIQEKNAGRPTFILHDGPPYANGNLHMGHALNKVSKDFIVRYKSMSGFRAPYVPGWDTHGLPIEQALINRDKIDRKDLSIAAFRSLCEEYALEQVNNQKESFMRLGVTGDWDHPYLTLAPEYEAQQIRVFGKMAARGLIYKGKKPIYWSPSSESSLAEAEIEYQDVTSSSIFVSFKIKETKGVLPEDSEFVIWTTTPWTIPANMAIAVSPQAEYSEVLVDDHRYIVATDLVEELAVKFGWEAYEVGATHKGADLEYLTAQHPMYDRESLVILGDHVTLDSGTGLVHTAPGHGEDDYVVGQKYGLEVLSPIDDRGHFTAETPDLEGMFYIKGNRVVMEILEDKGVLLAKEEIVHSYPHDWRTKKPVIFRATPQWFASIDKIRDELLETVDNEVTWYHPSGKVRMYNMVRDRGDWVISRQRVWGVPLPIFYAENGEEILDEAVINHVADLFEEHGSNIWFEWESKDLLPAGYTHPASPNGEFTREKDIMDVWFDSGTSYAGVLKTREDLSYPADMYLEGSDQYRGWFNSSFTTSVAAFDQAPYRSVLSQGFVMDGKGEKMSKSLGNVIEPDKVMEQLGADIIRLWVSSVDYENDVRISQDILKQNAESYRRIRNTIRFLLANVQDFDPAVDRVAEADLKAVDQYLLAKHRLLVHDIIEAYETYDFIEIHKNLLNFISNDLSSFYLDFAKDVIYIEKKDSVERRAMQTVIYQVAYDLILLLTPILVHTMEEAWAELPGVSSYVQLQDMPEVVQVEESKAIVAQWAPFFAVRSEVLKALENRRNDQEDPIKKAFEAKVTLYLTEELETQLKALTNELALLLIVSEVEVKPLAEAPADAHEGQDLAVVIDHAIGEKCERCWAIRPDVGSIEAAEHLCQRCYHVVKDEYPEVLEK